MTKQQAQWAQQHDWFCGAMKFEPNNYAVRVVERATLDGVPVPDQHLTFYNFEALRAWAGY